MNAALDEVELDLIRAWVAAWDEISLALAATVTEIIASNAGGRVSQAAVQRNRALGQALAQAEQTIEALVRDAGGTVTQSLTGFTVRGFDGAVEIIRTQLPPGQVAANLVFDRFPEEALDAIVTRTADRITSLLRPLTTVMSRAMRAELIRGIAVGDNPETVARRIMRAVEGRFNGGLSRAVTITRTEMLDAHRRAGGAANRANRAVLRGWMWWAKLDAKTCPSCAAQHGQIFDVDESGPADHQRGRCTGVPITKPWSELGFDIDEPDSEPVTAEDWFDGLTSDTQRRMLGPARYQAWVAGDYPMSQWSVRRENPGWRDSYVTSPAPAGYGRS